MLNLSDLRQFSTTYAASRPNLETAIVVANDDEVSKLITDLANAGSKCTLITVIPTHDPNFKDEDTREMQNNLLFFVVKKTDSTGGNNLRLDNFEICQTEIRALFNYILNVVDTDANCIFKKIEYNQGAITPVSDYFGQNGYMLEFTSKSYL